MRSCSEACVAELSRCAAMHTCKLLVPALPAHPCTFAARFASPARLATGGTAGAPALLAPELGTVSGATAAAATLAAPKLTGTIGAAGAGAGRVGWALLPAQYESAGMVSMRLGIVTNRQLGAHAQEATHHQPAKGHKVAPTWHELKRRRCGLELLGLSTRPAQWVTGCRSHTGQRRALRRGWARYRRRHECARRRHSCAERNMQDWSCARWVHI